MFGGVGKSRRFPRINIRQLKKSVVKGERGTAKMTDRNVCPDARGEGKKRNETNGFVV